MKPPSSDEGIPELRLAICRRCRWPSRIASGASTDTALLACARTLVHEGSTRMHVRISQCLNSCDGGHTVRLELRGREVALVGVRDQAELREIVANAREIALGELSARWQRRVYQIWRDGELLYHLNLHDAEVRSRVLASLRDEPSPRVD